MCHDSCAYVGSGFSGRLRGCSAEAPGYGYTDSLPLGSGCLESRRMDTPEVSPPAEIKISRSPDTLQTGLSATSTEMTGGSPPAHIDICEDPD